MATASQILEVRNNANITTADYDDTTVGDLIDASSVNCASATIWRWEWSKLGKDAAKAIKKANAGAESHEYNSIKDQMDYYKSMYELYEQLCKEENGEGTVNMIKVKRHRVGGVITQDEIDEYLNT